MFDIARSIISVELRSSTKSSYVNKIFELIEDTNFDKVTIGSHSLIAGATDELIIPQAKMAIFSSNDPFVIKHGLPTNTGLRTKKYAYMDVSSINFYFTNSSGEDIVINYIMSD